MTTAFTYDNSVLKNPGFMIDVPVTLTVAIRGEGLTEARAIELAEKFAREAFEVSDGFLDGYNESVTGATITEASLENPSDESSEVMEELEPEEED